MVPYDGSSSSQKALRETMMLAQDLQGNVELILMDVVQDVMVPAVMLESPFRSSITTGEQTTSAEMAKELHQQLKKLASKMPDDKKQNLEGARIHDLHVTKQECYSVSRLRRS